MNKYVPYDFRNECFEDINSPGILTKDKDAAMFYWSKEEAAARAKQLNIKAPKSPWIVMAIAVPRVSFKSMVEGDTF